MTGPETAELDAVDAALAGRDVPPEHADLAALALLLRDDRPEPAASWAAELDRRVATGFPAPPRRRPRLRLAFRQLLPAAAVAALVLMIAVPIALLPKGSDDEGASGGSAGVTAIEEDAAGGAESRNSAGDGLAAPAAPAGDPRSDARDDREVVRSAALTLAAPPREIDRVASRAGEIAAELGGFVRSSTITSSEGGDIELRVPSSRIDTAVQRLSRLGRVREISRDTRDITSVVVSARERLDDARAERTSLLRQLAEATTLNETESLRARLRDVSREIASARSRLRSANNRAQFANISIALVAAGGDENGGAGAWTPGDALRDAVDVLEVAAAVALLVLAVSLPLLVAGGLGWLARRGVTRRRRERALDMA